MNGIGYILNYFAHYRNHFKIILYFETTKATKLHKLEQQHYVFYHCGYYLGGSVLIEY